MKKYNFLIGGGKMENMQIFLSTIILGYFGIKIIYGYFFNFYPEKYYYRNIQINSNENSENNNITENITLNAYIPGMWNNEMTDFITLIILVFIIYIYTNVYNKSFIDENGNLNLSFIFGYLIGLGYPIIKKSINISNIVKYILLIIFILSIIVINYRSTNELNKQNYLIYSFVIIIVFIGLFIGKKKYESYSTANYFYNNGEQCTFVKNGVLQTSGEVMNITMPFAVFIILLFFAYEPTDMNIKNIYTFIYALLLGILVSSISYYGIEYFLKKMPLKQCNNVNECTIKNMTPIIEEQEEQSMSNNIIIVDPNSGNNGRKTIKFILVLFILLIIIYLIYFNIKK